MTNEEREKGDKILGERKGASLNKFLIKILKLYALVHSQWNLFLSFYSNCRNYIFGKSKVVTNWDPRPPGDGSLVRELRKGNTFYDVDAFCFVKAEFKLRRRVRH